MKTHRTLSGVGWSVGPWPLLLVLCLAGFIETARAQEDGRMLDERLRHLGDSEMPDWPGVEPKPEGTSLRLEFTAAPNATPVALRLRQRDVDGVWRLRVNGREVGELLRKRAEKDCYHELPGGVLRAGTNVLELIPDNPTDDIAAGRFVLYDQPLRTLLRLRPVNVQVNDADTGAPLPVRLSIQAGDGGAPDVYFAESRSLAVREGLVYLHGTGRFELPAGRYRIAATRGMEWSRDEREIELADGPASVELRLRREVDTTGFIAADTHLHTFTFSGHGDATTEERMITLAGEGVELAVATDHNHNTDYRPYQEKLELTEYFTPVTGNEVTTPTGHFNGFPLQPGDAVPVFEETDWVKVVADIRLKGAKVVILNHPRWPDIAQSPLTRQGLNRASGDRASGTRYTFDAMELVNSTVDTKDPLYLFIDWFGLLNAGEKISAVGSSDTHSVGDPAGQGRTYIPSATDDPAKLNVDELCENILQGRSAISLGIFADVKVDERFRAGDLVPVQDGRVRVRLRVAAPGWIHPRQAHLFVNGAKVAEQDVPAETGRPTNASLEFVIPVKGVDAHLVCVVVGDPVTHPGWRTLNDYTLAATNPVFLDVNGDGHYNSPRESARRIVASLGGSLDALIHTLDVVPPPVGVQLLALVHDRYQGAELARLDAVIGDLADGSPLYALYRRHRAVPPPETPAAPQP